MLKSMKFVSALATLGLGLAACSNGDNNVHLTPGPNPVPTAGVTRYTQIELLSRPAVKEVFETFAQHSITNAAEPYNDPTIQTAIQQTEDLVRYGSTTPQASNDYGTIFQSVLYPNEYAVDLSQTTGGFLSYELGGKLSNGGKFGGRAPNDDVIGLELLALFGNGLSALGIAPDDHRENNCLSAQNVTQRPSQATSGAFPYLPTPH